MVSQLQILKTKLACSLILLIITINSQEIYLPNNSTISITKMNQTHFKVFIRSELNKSIAIGYGNEINNTDINILELNSDKTFSLLDSYSKGKNPPIEDTKLNGHNDLLNPLFIIDADNKVNFTFYRFFDTKDIFDKQMDKDTNWADFIIQSGDGKFEFNEKNFNNFKIFFTNENIEDNVYLFSFWGFTICWTLLAYLGFFFSRYFKHRNFSVTFHIFIMTVVSIFSFFYILITLIQIKFNIGNSTSTLNNFHHIICSIFACLLIAQIFLGLFNYFSIYHGELISDHRHTFLFNSKFLHKCFGIVLLISSFMTIISGFLLKIPDLLYVPILLLVISISILVYLEIRFRVQNANKTFWLEYRDDIIHLKEGRKKLNIYNDKKISEIIQENPNLIIVAYNDLLIDLTDFINIHPGGKNLIYSNQLTEIGRFLNGNQPISSKYSSHNHSFAAINRMLESYIIGKYDNENFLLYKNMSIPMKKNLNEINQDELEILNSNSKDKSFQKKNSFTFEFKCYEYSKLYDNLIYFENRRSITECIWEMKFKLDDHKFPVLLTGHEWIGKYVTLYSREKNISRNYTICLCLLEKNQHKLKILYTNLILLEQIKGKIIPISNRDEIKYTNENTNLIVNSENMLNTKHEESLILNNLNESVENYDFGRLNNLNENDYICNEFSLFVKYYNQSNGMSKFLSLIKPGSSLLIKAPIGFGLRLEKRLSGLYILFGRGTGVLPYLDFASLIIRYIFYLIPKDNFDYANNLIDKEDFSFIDKDFKLILYASYDNKQNELLHELLSEADRLDKKYNLGKFLYNVNYEKTFSKDKWNSKHFESTFKKESNIIKKIYLCGTNQFMEYIKEEILRNDLFSENKIFYV